MKSFDADLIRSSSDTMVLAALADEPRYGYQLLQALRAHSDGLVGLSAGTLYPILHRLEVEGAVRGSWKQGTTRRRKYYSLTPKGKRLLRDKAEQWQRFSTLVDSLLKPALAAL
ncbi:MAG: PadR family transcriptional regulator [Planctomycetota bacterium]|jgi:PadR family transcriptional regulator PadR